MTFKLAKNQPTTRWSNFTSLTPTVTSSAKNVPPAQESDLLKLLGWSAR